MQCEIHDYIKGVMPTVKADPPKVDIKDAIRFFVGSSDLKKYIDNSGNVSQIKDEQFM